MPQLPYLTDLELINMTERADVILSAAMTLARQDHYHRISRADVASKAGCGAGTVNLYFGDMEGLRDAVVTEAVRTGDTDIIAQAIVSKHPAVAGKRVQVVG